MQKPKPDGGRTRVVHELEPVFDAASRVLILGSIPSPKSRAAHFYYAHPQNRFWRVMAELFCVPFPQTAAERRRLALSRGFALWDVLASCSIRGADDASIRSPVPNDPQRILAHAPIEAVFCTGQKAFSLYRRFWEKPAGRAAVLLPSTSPANCRVSFESLCAAYAAVRDICEKNTR